MEKQTLSSWTQSTLRQVFVEDQGMKRILWVCLPAFLLSACHIQLSDQPGAATQDASSSASNAAPPESGARLTSIFEASPPALLRHCPSAAVYGARNLRAALENSCKSCHHRTHEFPLNSSHSDEEAFASLIKYISAKAESAEGEEHLLFKKVTQTAVSHEGGALWASNVNAPYLQEMINAELGTPCDAQAALDASLTPAEEELPEEDSALDPTGADEEP